MDSTTRMIQIKEEYYKKYENSSLLELCFLYHRSNKYLEKEAIVDIVGRFPITDYELVDYNIIKIIINNMPIQLVRRLAQYSGKTYRCEYARERLKILGDSSYFYLDQPMMVQNRSVEELKIEKAYVDICNNLSLNELLDLFDRSQYYLRKKIIAHIIATREINEFEIIDCNKLRKIFNFMEIEDIWSLAANSSINCFSQYAGYFLELIFQDFDGMHFKELGIKK